MLWFRERPVPPPMRLTSTTTRHTQPDVTAGPPCSGGHVASRACALKMSVALPCRGACISQREACPCERCKGRETTRGGRRRRPVVVEAEACGGGGGGITDPIARRLSAFGGDGGGRALSISLFSWGRARWSTWAKGGHPPWPSRRGRGCRGWGGCVRGVHIAHQGRRSDWCRSLVACLVDAWPRRDMAREGRALMARSACIFNVMLQ